MGESDGKSFTFLILNVNPLGVCWCLYLSSLSLGEKPFFTFKRLEDLLPDFHVPAEYLTNIFIREKVCIIRDHNLVFVII